MKSYKEIEGWFDYEDLYERFSNDLKDDSKFVEIGVWKGRSICFLGQLILIKNKKTKLFAVDTFKGSQDEEKHLIEVEKLGGSTLPLFEENIKNLNLEEIITPIENDSIKASSLFEDNSLEIIFIDANHSYEGVKNDITAWFPKLKQGGIMGGHDFWAEQVKKAVIDYFAPINKNVQGVSNSCWAVQK